MEIERSILLSENHQKIFARNYRIDTSRNNLEKDLADFIFSMGRDKGMINPMRVANRLAVLCGRANPLVSVVDILRHPDDWKFNAIRSEEEQFIISSGSVQPKKPIAEQVQSYTEV